MFSYQLRCLLPVALQHADSNTVLNFRVVIFLSEDSNSVRFVSNFPPKGKRLMVGSYKYQISCQISVEPYHYPTYIPNQYKLYITHQILYAPSRRDFQSTGSSKSQEPKIAQSPKCARAHHDDENHHPAYVIKSWISLLSP
jgi:hypothetical protein